MVVARPPVETATCLPTIVTGHKTDTAPDLGSDFERGEAEINLDERNLTNIYLNHTHAKKQLILLERVGDERK